MKKEFNPAIQKLKQMQSLPLEQKITMSKMRIRQWHEHYDGNVIVSFSGGGVDSTVLLHLVRSVYPDVKAVFINTGLEYPQIVRFVHSVENVDIIRPKLTYKEVIEKYGYPLISKETAQKIHDVRTTTSQKLLDIRLGRVKGRQGVLAKKWRFLVNAPFKISHYCCDILKKKPIIKYRKEHGGYAYTGIMAEESALRIESYVLYSCNAFNQKKNPTSRPLMFWTKQDILQYIKKYNLDYCKAVYGEIEDDPNGGLRFSKNQSTGCTFCMFGVHMEKYPNRFQRMQTENPALYDYCINKLNLKEPLEYCNIPYDKDDYRNRDEKQTEIEFVLEP